MVTRHTLSNGLTVLLDEEHASPVAAVLTHVKTGYFNEEDRLTGISHLLEHMYFKGTPRRPGPEDIAQATKAIGGTLNAFTYYEETGYYTVAPSDRLADALDIQADALANTQIDADQLKSETEVVLQEAQQKRDAPWAYATETLFDLAFDTHRIRRWRIGEPEILRAWTREDMVSYYRGAYHPENMVLVVGGDVTAETALPLIERHYGGLPGGPRYISPGPEEARQTAPRYRQMRGDIRQRLVLMGWHTVAARHAHSYALDFLGALLSDGRSSRLFQNVRERQGLATALQAYHQTFNDIGFFLLAGESLGDDLNATERALWSELRRLQEEPPRADEMERVRTRIRSRIVFEQEEPLGRARRLAAYEAMGDYRMGEEETERLLAVSAEDVQRVAGIYFKPENTSLLEYVPEGSSIREGSPETVAAIVNGSMGQRGNASTEAGGGSLGVPPAPLLDAETSPIPSLERRGTGGTLPVPGVPASASPPPHAQEAAQQLDLGNGGTLAARRSGSVPVIALEALFPGGRLLETEHNAGITNLMLRTMVKGTASRSSEGIANAFEGLGSSLDTLHGLDFWGFGFQTLADRFDDALELMADVLRNPTFPAEELEREKAALFADIRRAADSGMERALDLLDEAAYGAHPYSFPERGVIAALKNVTPDDLRAWHARVMQNGVVAGAAGALTVEGVRDALAAALPSRASETAPPVPIAPFSGVLERVEQRDRKQSAAALGFMTVDAASEDRFALDTISQIVSGLGGRFFAEVRGRQGLAYVVSAWHSVRKDGGTFVAYTATDPQKEEQARAALLHEFARLREEPVTDEELDRAKTFIAGAKTISLQTARAQSRDLSRNVLYGRGVEASQEYVTRIQSLTPADLQTAAQRYFNPERYAVGVLRGTAG